MTEWIKYADVAFGIIYNVLFIWNKNNNGRYVPKIDSQNVNNDCYTRIFRRTPLYRWCTMIIKCFIGLIVK